MDQLEESRLEIEKIDKEMAKLFEKRMLEVKKIIQYKKENNYPVYDQPRETFLLIRNGSYIEDDEIRHLYMELLETEFDLSKRLQKRYIYK